MKIYTLDQVKKTYCRKLGFALIVLSVNVFGEIVKADYQPRGAQMPYIRYESEAAEIGNGAELLGPTYDQNLIASEASDRQCVQLNSTGAFIQWVVTEEAQGMVLRFSIPDSSIGGGINRTLTLYINSTDTVALQLSSKHAWQYFPSDNTPSNNPAVGGARMRFDEMRLILPDTIFAGDTIRLERTAPDIATYYAIDFIELEAIPAEITKPAGYLDITDYGAIPDDGLSDYTAINNAISAASSTQTGLYIPKGTFNSSSVLTLKNNVTIQGAGAWYTQIYFLNSGQGGFNSIGTNVKISDLFMDCANTQRQTYRGFGGYYGAGSHIDNIWITHFEVGGWIANYASNVNITDSLWVSNCRFRNTYADGFNLAKGTKNCLIENCNFRNTGDDAMATWSSNATEVPECFHNEFRNNTVENTYRAGGLGIFGGRGHKVHHCLIKDMLNDGGIRVTSIFEAHDFSADEYMYIHDITLVRTGPTTEWGNFEGAINLQTRNFAVRNIKFEDIIIDSAEHHGIFIKGENSLPLTEIYFKNVEVNHTGKYGVYIENSTQGWGEKNNLTFSNTTSGEYFDNAPFYFRDEDIEVLTVTTSTGGTVTLDPAGGSYATGTPVTLTAVPANGYEFANWTGNITGNVNPSQLTMDSYKTVMANFTEISAIPDINAKPSLPTVSPNPTENFLDIQFNASKISAVLVFDCTGKKIISEPSNLNSTYFLLDLSNVQRGVYIISLLTNDKSLIYKVIRK